jgi:cytochrome c-type biogenesis protein CcmF
VIDSPVSREGAFLANNVLFVGFAFIVLLGTVFPLLYEALNPNSSVAVGAPYFNRFFIPVGLALLFLMAVAPALPWRKTSVEVMRGRLAAPAAIGVVTVVVCVVAGVHGVEPLLAFGLGAFAAASAGRALVLSVRAAYRSSRAAGAAPARSVMAGWRGFVGRANGGMVVHIGVVVIAIGLAAATSFLHRGELRLSPGRAAVFAGHTVDFVGTRQVTTASHSAFEAELRLDGRGLFYPAISQFGSGTQAVGTPAIDSSWRDDLYLTIDSIPSRGNIWTFGVVEQPLVMWLWIGAVLVGVGSVLSAIPGRRRRPTDPISQPVVTSAPSVLRGGARRRADGRPEADEGADGAAQPLPVGAGDPS